MIELLLVIFGAVIGKLTEWLIENIKRRKENLAVASIAHYEDILQWGWDGCILLDKLIDLDRQVIGEALTIEREGTVNQWAPIFIDHPNNWILLIKGPKKIIGYWHFVTLKDEDFLRAKKGELLDGQITNDMVVPIDVPGIYNLYFIMIGVLPEYKFGGAKLIEEFFNRIEMLANRGVYFREMCANAFTKNGKRLCEGFGMSIVGEHKDFGNVYTLSLIPWPKTLHHGRWKNLIDLYDNKF